MTVRKTADQATANWVRNLSSATTAITAGVNAVTTAPGQAAAAQAQKWLTRVTESAAKWKSRVGSVTLADWQKAMTSIGIPRISQGAQAKQGKFSAFMAEFLPFLERGIDSVNRMPSTTLEDNIQRAVTMIRHNATFRRGGGSGSGV